MRTEYFIAKRLLKAKGDSKKISKPIVNISLLSIVLGVAVMIITVSAVVGFQNEVKEKVIGFGSHIQIMNAGEYSPYESTPMLKDQAFYSEITKIKGVKHIQSFAYKPAILQSEKDTVKYKFNGVDTFEVKQEISGVIVKGIGEDYDWSFFKSKMISGTVPSYIGESISYEIIISESIAKQMHYELGDTIDSYFIQERPKKRNLVIKGIYKTGLEEFDRELILGDLKLIQRMNNWGINASYVIEDTVDTDYLKFRIDAIGGTGRYLYDFGHGYQYKGYGYINPNRDTTVQITVTDYARINGIDSLLSVPDTIWLELKVTGDGFMSCTPKEEQGLVPEREYLDEDGFHYKIPLKHKEVEVKTYNSGKSAHEYVGGFEVILDSWDDLDNVDQIADEHIVLPSLITGQPLRVETIKKIHQDIFDWLNFLDVLAYIIIILMILVAVINMGSTLLVLILEKTNMIGIMKSFGTNNSSLRKVFIFHAAFIVLKGMFWGNLLGIAVVLIQSYFKIIPLDPEVYFMDHVAMEFNIWHLLLLNVTTLVICVVALMLPVLFISNVKPVKAIKFN